MHPWQEKRGKSRGTRSSWHRGITWSKVSSIVIWILEDPINGPLKSQDPDTRSPKWRFHGKPPLRKWEKSRTYSLAALVTTWSSSVLPNQGAHAVTSQQFRPLPTFSFASDTGCRLSLQHSRHTIRDFQATEPGALNLPVIVAFT
jgi:hypothetical protein